jgi:hypothetical protein
MSLEQAERLKLIVRSLKDCNEKVNYMSVALQFKNETGKVLAPKDCEHAIKREESYAGVHVAVRSVRRGPKRAARLDRV